MFFPVMLCLASILRLLTADTRESRIFWGKFTIASVAYVFFVPGLDGYFDHLVWRVFRPQGRFGHPAYDFVEFFTMVFPIGFHAVAALASGWLAASATRLFLACCILASCSWLMYPLVGPRRVWIDPLFDARPFLGISATSFAFGLVFAITLLAVLQLLSRASSTSRGGFLNYTSTVILATVLVVTFLGSL